MHAMTHHFDICIRGGGIVGHTLALLMAQDRHRVGLYAPASATSTHADVRAYALNAKSKTLLESIRCWPEPQEATAVASMQIKGDSHGMVNFSAEQLHVPALTWIVDVPALETKLREAVRFNSHIELIDSPHPATLTVICEGRNSQTRLEFGADFVAKRYPHHAIAARLHCEKPHAAIARQWFAQREILAFLPLDGTDAHNVAMVWSALDENTAGLLAAEPQEFCNRLEAFTESCLGKLSLISDRKAWALQSAQASRWIGVANGQSWALAGDAAHNVHPLAGQGLNLGLSDVAELASILHRRTFWRPVNDVRLLRRYERSRKAEVTATDLTMTGLQKLFNQSHGTWQSVRNWGMNGFERSRSAKSWVARLAMGL